MNSPRQRSITLALALGQLASWAFLYFAFTSFVLPMREALGWTQPQVMTAYTIGLAVWGIASYGVGAAIDRGLGRAVMTCGAVLAGLGFLLWSQATSLVALYAAWGLLGVAMAALLYEPAFSILAKRFPASFRSSITVLTLFGGFGSTLSFTAVTWLVAHHDWRMALVLIGAVMLLLVAPMHAWALRGEVQVGATVRRSVTVEAVDADATLRRALGAPAFWLLTATFTLYAFAAAGLWAHIMPALADKGRTPVEALEVVVWFGPAQVLGRFLFLLFERRYPSHASLRAMGVAVFVTLAAALTLFAVADEVWSLRIFSVVFGISNGLVTIVRGGIVPDYFGRAHLGRINGAMSVVVLVTRAFAPVATAWALVAAGGYRPMLLLLAAAGILSVLTFALARRPRPRTR